MKCKILLLSLISLFLVFALVNAVSAQTRTVGVAIGNTWTLDTSADWSSTDPKATPPAQVKQFNDTDWLQITVTNILGTNVTAELKTRFKNGTETNIGGWIDIDSGNNENMTFMIVGADLNVSDSIYAMTFSNYYINETVQKTYQSGQRLTNHVNITSSVAMQYLSSDLYWDKTTGIVVELSTQNIYQTLNYTTSWSIGLQIINSTIWAIPEFPTPILALLMSVTVTSVMIVISTKNRQLRTRQTCYNLV